MQLSYFRAHKWAELHTGELHTSQFNELLNPANKNRSPPKTCRVGKGYM